MLSSDNMNRCSKILAIFSYVNIVSIFLLISHVALQNNNHYGFAFDQIFLTFSSLLLIASFCLFSIKKIILNSFACILSLALNLFNISIDYPQWIERGQPDIFSYCYKFVID